jgi:hypothetical protein
MLAMTSEVPAGLTDPDAKTGGYYELSIWLGDRDDARLQTAIEALASAADVTGPWHQQSDGFVSASWTVADVADEGGGVWGEVELPDGRTLICFVLAIRYDNGEDWLDLSIPTTALANSDRRVGGYPFGSDGGPQSLPWRLPIDAWFASLAAQVRQVTGSRQALIGWEVSGEAVESAHSPRRPGVRPLARLLRRARHRRGHALRVQGRHVQPGQYPENVQRQLDEMVADGWQVNQSMPNYTEFYILWQRELPKAQESGRHKADGKQKPGA